MPHYSSHPMETIPPRRKNDVTFDNRCFTEPSMPTSDTYGHRHYESRPSPHHSDYNPHSNKEHHSKEKHRQSAYNRLSANHREPQPAKHSSPESREPHGRHEQLSHARKHVNSGHPNTYEEKQSRPHSYPEWNSQSVNHKHSPAHRSINGPLKPILKRSTKTPDVDQVQNHRNHRAPHESRPLSRHADIRDHMPHIPQAHPPPLQGPPHPFSPSIIVYAHPPKEKKKAFMERLKKAFADFVADEKIPSLPLSQQGTRHNSSSMMSQHDSEDDAHPRDMHGIHQVYGRSNDHGYESSTHRQATPRLSRGGVQAPYAHALSPNVSKSYQSMEPYHRSDRSDKQNRGFSPPRSRTEFADYWKDPMSTYSNTHHNASRARQ